MSDVALESFRAELERLRADAAAALAAARDAAAVEAARVEFAGARSGRLKTLQKSLGGLAAADKPAGGRLFNEAKAVNVINHDNIVKVVDYAYLDEKAPYFVMYPHGSSPSAAAASGRPGTEFSKIQR